MKMRPIRFITSTCAPFAAWNSPAPRPGVPGGKFAGRSRSRLPFDEHQRLALIPGVIAGRHGIGARVQQFLADRFGDAEAAGGVLPIDDDEIGAVAVAQLRQLSAYGFAAGTPDDIAEKQNAHYVMSLALLAPDAVRIQSSRSS